MGEVAVKGFEKPIALWKMAGPRRVGAERRTFIGRQTELRQLDGVLDSVQETRSGLVVCVRGEAGIGKSGLMDELRERAQSRGFACHMGLVLDFGVGKGQDAIPAIVKDLLEAVPSFRESIETASKAATEQTLIALRTELRRLVRDVMARSTATPMESKSENYGDDSAFSWKMHWSDDISGG